MLGSISLKIRSQTTLSSCFVLMSINLSANEKWQPHVNCAVQHVPPKADFGESANLKTLILFTFMLSHPIANVETTVLKSCCRSFWYSRVIGHRSENRVRYVLDAFLCAHDTRALPSNRSNCKLIRFTICSISTCLDLFLWQRNLRYIMESLKDSCQQVRTVITGLLEGSLRYMDGSLPMSAASTKAKRCRGLLKRLLRSIPS